MVIWCLCICFFFNDTATTEIYTLSLHDALPIFPSVFQTSVSLSPSPAVVFRCSFAWSNSVGLPDASSHAMSSRSEEHTSELQSRQYLVCRLLLEKKK